MIPRELHRRLLLVLGGAALLGATLTYIGSLQHSLPEVVLIVLLGGLLVALAPWLVSRTGRYAERAHWVSTPRQEAAAPVALDYRLVRLRRDLRDTLERDDRPDSIYPVVRELAAERLRNRHEIDLDAEPGRARAAMTPTLWTYLSTPPTDTRRRSRSALHTAIEGIEQL